MIDDRERADRLARAIVSDLRLYHGEELRSGRELPSDALEEARLLFASRVAPDLVFLLEDALARDRPEKREPLGYRDAPASPEAPRRSLLPTLALVGIAVVVLAVLLAIRLSGVR